MEGRSVGRGVGGAEQEEIDGERDRKEMKSKGRGDQRRGSGGS